jgi:hypothetical protein
MLLVQIPNAIWPRAAIHDTVAAIVRQPAYRRSFGTTLLDRVLGWIGDAYSRLVAALGTVPHGRVVATIAAATVALLVVARIAYAARLRGVSATSLASGRGRSATSTDSWRDAEQLAAAGQFTEAAHALYRGTVAMLATRGLVRRHDSKTSGDYARELRRRGAPAYAAFRRFGARYDRIIYGTGLCDAAGYDALLADARAVLERQGERAA